MRRLAILAGGALVLLSSCAATLQIRGTAPAFDNAGTCTTPTLTAAVPGALVAVHVSVSGPAAFQESLLVAAGTPFQFTRLGVPAGTYTVRAWAADAGGSGCDTTITITAKNPPWRVRL